MSVSIPEFWRLAAESRLLAPADCERLDAKFAGVKGAASQSNASTLAEWLVANRVLTHYHTRTLLSGKAGRFYFGDYYVYDRVRSKEGRLASLLRAVHLPTHHPVMLYLVTGLAADDPQWWQVAVQQVAWACSVGHPFVVQCYQMFEAGRHKVVAIEELLSESPVGVERVEGKADNTLATRFGAGARVAPADACRVAYQASMGLARLHQLGQVHGSVRPENIWLHHDGSVKLLQTPLAPEPAMGPGPVDWTANDSSGKLIVAADFAAPELAQAGRTPDMLTDVYALGATMYQMLSGWPPFPGGTIAGKLARHASETPPKLESIGVPQPLAQLVGFLMAKDPLGRYQTAVQAAEALAYFIEPAVASFIPAPLPTALAFDQWLETQPRVPGIAAGAIPTASGLAAYSAAHYAASAPNAAPAAPAQQSIAPTVSQSAPADTSSNVPAQAQQESSEPTSFFESIQPDEPAFDAPGFAAAEQARAAEQGFDRWDDAPTDYDTAPTESGPAIAAQTAPPEPEGFDLEAVLNSEPLPIRPKPRLRSTAPKSRLRQTVVLAFGGGLAVVLIFTGVILYRAVKNGGAGSDSLIGTVATSGNGGPFATNTATNQNAGKAAPGPGAVASAGGTKNNSKTTKPATNASTGPPPIETVADDGISLWASPTSGPPLSTDYVGNDAQLILAIRPAEIMRRPDGDQLLQSLGPWGDLAAHAIKDATGFDLNQIDQIVLVIHESGDGKPVATEIMRTADKISPNERLTAWGNAAPVVAGNATIYQGTALSYYLPAKEAGKLLVIGPAAQIKEIAQPSDGPPPMPRSLELMLPHTDADRDISLVFVPAYFFSDGQSLFAGPLASLEKPLGDFFGSDVGAAEFSLHFDANFFAEMRVVGVAGKESNTVADDLVRQLKTMPMGVENDLDALNLHPYDRKLVHRLPEWMRLLTEYTRSGVEDGQPVLRCYLPNIAAGNLLMASELALEEQPVLAANVAAAGPKRSQSIAELLKTRTTLSFPRDTLEKSLQMLFQDVGIQYEILGGDLQLEGITKNQSFGLDEHDKTVEEILQKIMRLANPDGKLVYVIKPKTPGGPEMLFITTRAAVAKRGDKLPPGLATGPSKPTSAKKKS